MKITQEQHAQNIESKLINHAHAVRNAIRNAIRRGIKYDDIIDDEAVKFWLESIEAYAEQHNL